MIRTVIIILLLCPAFIVNAQSAADQIRVNEVFLKTPLSTALKTIAANYSVKVAYDHNVVQNILVALNLEDLSLPQTFERLLEGTPLTYHNVDDNFIIIPRPPEAAKSPIGRKDFALSGTVVDVDTEETLPLATIRIHGTAIATTTNNDGYFTLFDIPADTCSVEIRYLGYITQKVRINEIGNEGKFNVKLRSDAKILNEVVVLDENNQALRVEAQPGEFVFNTTSLSALPSMGEQDLSRTLQLLPGVSATDESSSGMIIRGSHSSYNLTLLDGMTIYQQDHFFGAFSIINADIVKDVHVQKGMFDAKHGGRVSGVIDITAKNGNAVKPAFNFKLNPINAKATAEIPLGKKWSLFAGARRSFTDLAQTKLFESLFDIARTSNDQIGIFGWVEGLGSESTPQYYFYDANTKLTFKPSGQDVISLSFYVSRDKMNINDNISLGDDTYNFLFQNDELTHWGNNGLSLRWGRQWSDKYYSNIRLSDSRFFRRYDYQQYVELDTITSSYAFLLENSISDLSYAADNEWKFNNKVSLEFGLSGVRQKTNMHIRDEYVLTGGIPPDEESEDTNTTENDESWLHSVYGTSVFSPTSKLTTSVGARLAYYYNDEGKLYFEPRATAQYKLTTHLNLKGGYGRANQFITQLFYHSPVGSISGIAENAWMLSQPGDSRYPVISSDHVSTGATLKSKQFVYDAEVYYKENRGVIIDENLNSGTTNTLGLDLMVQKTSGIHKGWIAYSLGRGTQTHPYIQNGESAPSWQDQRHELKIVDIITLGKWNLSSTVIYGSGKPYPEYTVRYNYDDGGLIASYDLLLDYSNQSRLPAYFRIDLSASYKEQINKSMAIEMGMSIHNVTDHENIKTRKVDTAALEATIFTDVEVEPTYLDVTLLGFSPTLFVSFSF